MTKGGEHPNTEEPMNTQELLNTMVASQIQLREDMNLTVQQFQGSQDGRPHGLPITLTFPWCEIASQIQDANLGQVWRDWLPKSHLKMYMRAMQPLGAIEELLAQMFQNTLTRATLRWFLNLDDARARRWEDIYHEFHNQYKYNIEVDVTRRDLETTKQEPKESFSTFITKWRSKAA